MNIKQQMFDYEEDGERATAVSLKRQMETIQRFLHMALGAVLTFLLFALTDAAYIGREGFILWLVLFLGPPVVSLLLLISPTWRRLPLGKRIGPVMLGLSVSWLATFIFYASSLSGYGTPFWLRMSYLLFTAGYLLFNLGFWYFLQRRARAVDESLFP
jgi:nitrate reductase NapE component